jgi:Tfp pilus assembly protein PilO
MTKALAPIIFLALAVGLFFSYIRPAYDVLGAFQEQESRVNEALVKSNELKNRTTELVAKYADFEQQGSTLTKIQTTLPDSIDAVRLVINIDALAQKQGVTVTSFELPRIDRNVPESVPVVEGVPEQVIDPVADATLRVVANGNYANLKAFMQSLEKSLTILDITELSLAPYIPVAQTNVPVNKANGMLQASILLKTYWLR